MGKYNWEEIKSQIEIGKYSIKEIARKYKPEGTNLKSAYDYIRKKKKEKGWKKQEDIHKKYTENVKSKLAEDEAEKEAKMRKEYDEIITNIRIGVYETLMNERKTDRLRQYKLAMQTIKECRKEHWEVNEILDIADKKMTENQDEALDRFLEGIENMPVVE